MKENWNGVHVVVDLHGVIADFAHACIIRSGGPPPYQDEITEYEHPIFNGCWDKLKDPEYYYPVMPPIKDAVSAMQGMYSSGYYLTIASNCPREAHEYTVNWLEAWGIPFDRYLDQGDGITQRDGKNPAGGHILVDDKIDNCAKYAAQIGPAILFGQPWNRNDSMWPNYTRVVGWQQTLEQIRRWAHVDGRVPYIRSK